MEQFEYKRRAIQFGLFGNYLAVNIPFLLSGVLHRGNRNVRMFFLILFVTSIVLLALTLARSALAGTLVGCIVVILLSMQIKKVKIWIVLFLFVGIFISLISFGFKSQSALGRMTIYKVSVAIIKDHWIAGVGPGRFAVNYNNYQSAYFSEMERPIRQQLLADNTYEAFNSVIQILVEYGVLGMLVFGIAFYWFIKTQKINRMIVEVNLYRIGSVGCIASMIICSLFSNPFHVTPILILSILHLGASCNNVVQKNKAELRMNNVLQVFLIIVSFGIFYYAFGHYTAQKSWYKALNLSKYSNYNEAKKHYDNASSVLKTNGRFLFNYGAEAFINKDYDVSKSFLEESKKFITSSNQYEYLGDYYLTQDNFSEAEKHYLLAVYMVPSHLFPKYKLVKLYERWGNKEGENIGERWHWLIR